MQPFSLLKRTLCGGLLLASAAVSYPVGAAAPTAAIKRYEIKDFFGNPDRVGYQLSPDGKTLAFMAPFERRRNLHIVALPADGGAPDFAKAKRLTSETAR
ncbi:MAG: S9 family peptidase, partial [Acidobacteriota bacterium]|nr:S9 family peptidase [Acidobacteriota bacterium]